MPRPSRRVQLLDAAVAVIRRDGAAALTLEAQLTGEDFLTAYVHACDLSAADPDHSASEFGLLAGMIEEPEVLEATRERYAEWMSRILADAGDPVDAWLVRLAADGLWYSDLLGIAAPAGADRRRLMERLVALAQGGSR
jgi:hypothetical protein